jgi:hypothetical protein
MDLQSVGIRLSYWLFAGADCNYSHCITVELLQLVCCLPIDEASSGNVNAEVLNLWSKDDDSLLRHLEADNKRACFIYSLSQYAYFLCAPFSQNAENMSPNIWCHSTAL